MGTAKNPINRGFPDAEGLLPLDRGFAAALRPGGRLVVFGRYSTIKDGHKDWPAVFKWYSAIATVWLSLTTTKTGAALLAANAALRMGAATLATLPALDALAAGPGFFARNISVARCRCSWVGPFGGNSCQNSACGFQDCFRSPSRRVCTGDQSGGQRDRCRLRNAFTSASSTC